MRLRLVASAKLNWTFEVLGKREDGYHEVRSVLQTIALHDTVTLSLAARLEVRRTGAEAAKLGSVQEDTAYRAALTLRDEASGPQRGALIELEKAIPVAAGLGGGSSDAAAALRGLDRLWGLNLEAERLRAIAAALGSDVAFFLTGGTAIASGRGEEVVPLADVPQTPLTLVVPPESFERKTAQMYRRLRPEYFTSGEHTRRLVERLAGGGAPSDGDLFNAFESVLFEPMPLAARLKQECQNEGLRPHLAGSGPALFFLSRIDADMRQRLHSAGCTVIETTTSRRQESTAWEES